MRKRTKKKTSVTHHYTRPGLGVTVQTVVDTSGKVRKADNEDTSLMEEIANDIFKTIKKARRAAKKRPN